MKKALSIVLAAAFVLSMLPAMAAPSVTITVDDIVPPFESLTSGAKVIEVKGTVSGSDESERINLLITKEGDAAFAVPYETNSVYDSENGTNTYSFDVLLPNAVGLTDAEKEALEATYNITVGGDQVARNVSTTFTYEAGAKFKTLGFGTGASSNYDSATKTYKVTIPAERSLSELIPTFTTTENAVVTANGKEVVSGKTRLNFTSANGTMTLRVTNAIDESYTDYTVKVTKKATEQQQGQVSNPGTNTSPVTNQIYTDPPKEPLVVDPNFSDMVDAEWARAYIVDVAKQGIMQGVGNNLFEPNRLITREEFAKVLVEAFGLVNRSATCDFTDVPEDAWYYESVAVAASFGIVRGMGDGTFGVGRTISRQDMAVMAYRAAVEVKGAQLPTTGSAVFADSTQIAPYAQEAVVNMALAGIINGKGDGMFAPLDGATRAETAKIISTILNLTK